MVRIRSLKKYFFVFFFMIMLCASCKDFLTVVPKDTLTGNNFYESKEDVESNIAFMYSLFFKKIDETWMMGATGEARSGEIKSAGNWLYSSKSKVVDYLGENDLVSVVDGSKDWASENYANITQWQTYYQVIQSSNVLVEKLEEGIAGVTEAETKRYIAESKFIRNFTYFWMVRLYGDVVYYTDAYSDEAMARENMVSVINKCIADLKPELENIAWDLGDPSLKGARASKGSLIALLMHMNMWNAGFDEVNKVSYYNEVAELGSFLVKSNEHRLLPLTEEGWGEVVKGRSDESLFEFYRSINYGDDNNLESPIAEFFLRWPYKFPRVDRTLSRAYFTAEYMESIFPASVDDNRKEMWFEDMLADDGNFLLKKFAYNVYASGNENENPDNSYSIFRYADAILLWAEALCNLSRYPEAITAVDMVRSRAGAPLFTGSNSELPDFIFYEREREMFAEGLRWFDLVRTKKILNNKWVEHTLTLDQFNRGGWTWPIDNEALNNNPFMVLNTYWSTVSY